MVLAWGIGDREVSPTFERREHHEQVGDAVARVLVIETSWAPRSHRHRQAGLGDQLLRGLVETHQGTIRIVWPRIDAEDVFHGGDECGISLRRDDPLPLAMGLESVFFKTRPMVLSLARSTMPSSTTLFSSSRRVQRTRPLVGVEQARAISLASFSPSKIGGTAGLARGLRRSTASRPSSTSCLRAR